MTLTTPSPTPALPRRKLPLGIQTFAKLREQNCYYVDKTPHALHIVASVSLLAPFDVDNISLMLRKVALFAN